MAAAGWLAGGGSNVTMWLPAVLATCSTVLVLVGAWWPGWLAGWLAGGWLAGWLAGWRLAGWLSGWLAAAGWCAGVRARALPPAVRIL